MASLCGADCSACFMKDKCKGCSETCGKPFGGRCIAAEYIKIGGICEYQDFKDGLMGEINALLEECGYPKTDKLFELAGMAINMEYPLPNGTKVKMLDDKNVYLGCLIELPDMDLCIGAVADTGFILITSCGKDMSNPEIVAYKRR